MRYDIILQPGDIYKYITEEEEAVHYLVLSDVDERTVLVREMETGIVEAWRRHYTPSDKVQWSKVG